MAIAIEEEKKQVNWFAFAMLTAIVAILSAAIYYLFFINPAFIEVALTDSLKTLEEITKIEFSVSEIANSSALKNLKQYVGPVFPEPAYNPNPFK